MQPRRITLVIITAMLLVACAQPANQIPASDTNYSPFVPLDGTITPVNGSTAASPRLKGATPTLAPLNVTPPPLRGARTLFVFPTPNPALNLPTPRQDEVRYTVQVGDTLGTIAEDCGVSVETLMQANGLANPNLLSPGQILTIPAPTPGAPSPDFKIIPDSELVYGPAAAQFDLPAFVQSKGGFLVGYTQDVDGETLTGPQIVMRAAEDYSVNPRLLLALLEYRSHWVTQATADSASLEYPLGYQDIGHSGLYRQLTWAANELNRGYYLWQVNAISSWVLTDGTAIPANPTINAGTAGVQNLFSKLDDPSTWEADVTMLGMFMTYFFLYGFYPFDIAIEPLIPVNLSQPAMQLPFKPGVAWSFTGGPHGGWDTGSAWAALDFAPPGEPTGCTPSDAWVTAVADGWIVRSDRGAVVQDLDGDGYEQTGWTVLYMHIASSDRVKAGTYLRAGERLGHPSCEGGVANGTHVHLARRYNGEWISADGGLPFVLDGWRSSGTGTEYDGYLKRGDQTVEAWDGQNSTNQIQR
jgi:LasA protease